MAHKVIEGGIFHVKSSELDFGMAQSQYGSKCRSRALFQRWLTFSGKNPRWLTIRKDIESEDFFD